MCQDEIKHTFFSFAAFTHLLFTSKFSKNNIKNKRIQNRLNDMKMKFSNLKF